MACAFDFPYKAAAFDMDGTLLDSMKYWRQVNVDFLQARGVPLDEEVRADLRATSNRAFARRFADSPQADADYAHVMREIEARMRDYYQTAVEPKPGAKAFVGRLRDAGVRVCVATAAKSALAIPALARHGLMDGMEFLFSAQDANMTKEDPAYYRRLANMLGLAIDEIVLFDDALYAVRGARAAGMPVWAVLDQVQRRDEAAIRELAQYTVADYSALV